MDRETLIKAVNDRHSVRKYLDLPITDELIDKLNEEIDFCNHSGNLSIKLVINDEQAFSGFMSGYGKFINVKNYFVMAGNRSVDLHERIGYYGQRLVLTAQALGLNTCWVALNYSKKKCPVKLENGEKLVCVIAVGYGQTQGKERRSKPIESLYRTLDGFAPPKWFIDGVRCAMKAPTAINQQQFYFVLDGNSVIAKSKFGFYSKLDLGIVKYHFEIGAGTENFVWKLS